MKTFALRRLPQPRSVAQVECVGAVVPVDLAVNETPELSALLEQTKLDDATAPTAAPPPDAFDDKHEPSDEEDDDEEAPDLSSGHAV